MIGVMLTHDGAHTPLFAAPTTIVAMNTRRLYALGAVMVGFLLAQASQAGPEPGARLFLDLCSACHSIGGGVLAGPDLITVSHRSQADLRKALKRMEDNVGPLRPEQVDSLIGLLQSANAKEQIAEAANPPAVAIPPEQKAASSATGRRLFFGEQSLANRGVPCFACHAVSGRGGNLAVDLTEVHSRRSEFVLLSTAEQPPFSLMKAAYGGHPLTRQEAWHLLAFFAETAKGGPPAAERTGALHGIAAGLTLCALAGVAAVFRSRRAGARSRMIRKSGGA